MASSSQYLYNREVLPASVAAAVFAARSGATRGQDLHACDVRAGAESCHYGARATCGSNLPQAERTCSALAAAQAVAQSDKTRASSTASLGLPLCATPPRQHSGIGAADNACSLSPMLPTHAVCMDSACCDAGCCADGGKQDPSATQQPRRRRRSYLSPSYARAADGRGAGGLELAAHTQPRTSSGYGSASDLLLNTPSVSCLNLRRDSWPDAPAGAAGGTGPASGASASAAGSSSGSASASYDAAPEAAAAGFVTVAAADVARLAVTAAGSRTGPGAADSAGATGLLAHSGSGAFGHGTVTLHGMGMGMGGALSRASHGVASPSAAAACCSAGGSGNYYHYAASLASSFTLGRLQPCCPNAEPGADGGATAAATAAAADAGAGAGAQASVLKDGGAIAGAAAAGSRMGEPQSAASAATLSTPLRPQTPAPHDHAFPHPQQPAPFAAASPASPGAAAPSQAGTDVDSGHPSEPLLLAAQAAQLLQPCNEPDLPHADGQLQPEPAPAHQTRPVKEIEAALEQHRHKAQQQQHQRAAGRLDSNGILICGGGRRPQQQQQRAPGHMDSNGILICGGGSTAAALSFFATQSSRPSSVVSDDATPRFVHQAASAAAASETLFAYRRRRGQGQEVGYSAPTPEAAAAAAAVAVADVGAFTMDSSRLAAPPAPQQLQQLRMMDSPFYAAAVAAPAAAALPSPGSGSAKESSQSSKARKRRPGSGAASGMAALHRRYATPEHGLAAADAHQPLTPTQQQLQLHAGGNGLAEGRCHISDSSSHTSDSAATATAAATAAASAAAAVGGGGRLLAGQGSQIAEALAVLRRRAASDAAGDGVAAAAAVMAALAASTDGSTGGGMAELRRHLAAQCLAHVDSSSVLHQLSTSLGLSLGRWTADDDTGGGVNGAGGFKRACEFGYAADVMAPAQPARDGGAAAAAALAAAFVAALGQSHQTQTQAPSDGAATHVAGPAAPAQAQVLPQTPQCFRAASLCASSILDGPLAAGFTALIDQLLAAVPDQATQSLGGYVVDAGDVSGGGAAAAPAAGWAAAAGGGAAAAAVPEAVAMSAAATAAGAVQGSPGGVSGGGRGGSSGGQRKASLLGRLIGGCFGPSTGAE